MAARRDAGRKGRPGRASYAARWNRFGVLSPQLESVEAVTQAHVLARSGAGFLTFSPIDPMFSFSAHRAIF